MAIPETPITRQEMYLDAIARKGSGGGGCALPSVTSDDNGKVLGVVDGAWAADDNRFVVTLTPTNPDYSGTMDKTAEEIADAYFAGKTVIAKMADFVIYPAYVSISDNIAFVHWFGIMSGSLVDINNLSNNKYSVKFYQLTPMGS